LVPSVAASATTATVLGPDDADQCDSRNAVVPLAAITLDEIARAPSADGLDVADLAPSSAAISPRSNSARR
jgi:hypothetical protein